MLKLCRDVFLVSSVRGARSASRGLGSEDIPVADVARERPAGRRHVAQGGGRGGFGGHDPARHARATRGARIPRRGAGDRGRSPDRGDGGARDARRGLSARAPASQMGSRRTSQTSCRAGTRSSPPCSRSPAVVSAVPPARAQPSSSPPPPSPAAARAAMRARVRARAPLAVVGGVACAFAGAEFAEPAATLGVRVGRVLASGSAGFAADVVVFRRRATRERRPRASF